MLNAFLLGGALSLVLQVVERFIPQSQMLLPLGGDDFVQSAGVILGLMAIAQIVTLLKK